MVSRCFVMVLNVVVIIFAVVIFNVDEQIRSEDHNNVEVLHYDQDYDVQDDDLEEYVSLDFISETEKDIDVVDKDVNISEIVFLSNYYSLYDCSEVRFFSFETASLEDNFDENHEDEYEDDDYVSYEVYFEVDDFETTEYVVFASDKDVELMANCVMAEAGNQSLDGKILVVDTILNRCLDPDFPSTIEEVIKQPGQFETYSNGSIYKVTPTEDCYKAIEKELKEISYPGVIYFRTERYSDYGTPWRKVGDHYFSTK